MALILLSLASASAPNDSIVDSQLTELVEGINEEKYQERIFLVIFTLHTFYKDLTIIE